MGSNCCEENMFYYSKCSTDQDISVLSLRNIIIVSAQFNDVKVQIFTFFHCASLLVAVKYKLSVFY